MKNKFGAVIVLYNTKLDESITINSFYKNNPFDCVLILDNSTNQEYEEYNESKSKEFGFTYHSFKKNLGLSKAYNYATNYFKSIDVDYICLWDDDTEITSEYINGLSTFNFTKERVYAPYIFHNDVLVNPSYFSRNPLITIIKGRKYRSVEKVGELVGSNKLYAINSGLIIPKQIFTSFVYDENIFLDCVDHYFCQEMYKKGNIIDIFPVSINQNYDNEESKIRSYEDNITRLQIRLKDLKQVDRKYFFINKCLVLLPLFLSTKDFRYIKLIFKKIK